MRKLLFGFLFIVSSVTYGKEHWPIKIGLSFMTESYSIQTKETNSTNEADASFFSGQIIPSIGFFLQPKILVGALYTQSIFGEFGVSGIGAHGRYYFLGGPSRVLQLEDLEVELRPDYSLYGGIAYKNLLIGSGDFDVRFNAIEASVGGERFMGDDYFLQASLGITHLSSSNIRNGISFGFSGGVGYNY